MDESAIPTMAGWLAKKETRGEETQIKYSRLLAFSPDGVLLLPLGSYFCRKKNWKHEQTEVICQGKELNSGGSNSRNRYR